MTDTTAILFAIDGAIAQCAVAKQLCEAQGQSTLPIEGVYASIMTLRALVDTDEAEGGDECPHPAESQEKQLLGGGHFVTTCHRCNDIIDQA